MPAMETAAAEVFVLTRDWRDTPRGVELVFWATGEAGPVRAVLREQEAVCFIARAAPSPPGVRRRQVALAALDGGPVDALYFRSWRELAAFREASGRALFEPDVRPADRFLMERFVTGAMRLEGRAERRGRFLEFTDPKVRAGAHRPALRSVSLDIETSGLDGDDPDQALWSIAVSGEGPGGETEAEAVFVVDPDRTPPAGARTGNADDPAPVHRLPDEPSVLHAFLAWIADHDPDLIIGWNVTGFDLRFLEARCRRHGIGFALGRDGAAARVLDGALATARIPGRVVLDGIEGHRAAFWGFEDESLGAVAHELLGRGKLIAPERNRLEAIRELYAADRAALAAYNLEDCRLVREIFRHTRLIDFMVERSGITGLALGRTGGSVAAFDHLYLPRLHRRGRVAPGTDAGDAKRGESPGGHVLDSRPGLYRNVALLDFKSLYPSIIRTFRIDPLGLAEPGADPVEGFEGARFAREGGILPELIATLWERRDEAKRTGDQPLQQAVKILMNSFYGVLGAHGCRFFDPRLASSITRRGHEIIRRSQAFLEDEGFEVIYGDTDSLFVLLEGRREAGALARGLAARLNEWWRETLAREHRLESRLEIEFETLFERFLMPTVRGSSKGTKKRYAGLVRRGGKDGGGGEPELVFKGLETVRTDWTPLARRFQRELYRKVFLDEPYEEFVRETHDALLAGALDGELVYRKRMRQEIGEYTGNPPPHVQAARKGGQSKRGQWVSYVVTANGPLPAEALDAPPDYGHYLERQLEPVADGILHFLGTSFENLTTPQLF